MLILHLLQRQETLQFGYFSIPFLIRSLDLSRQITQQNRPPTTLDRKLDNALEFAHITRPRVKLQRRSGPFRVNDSTLDAINNSLCEMFSEQENVTITLL